MRRGKRIDVTHGEVRDGLVAAGWSVLDTHDFPGFCDFVVWKGDQVRLIDAKSRRGGLTEAQQKLVARGCPIHFLRSAEDAVRLV